MKVKITGSLNIVSVVFLVAGIALLLFGEHWIAGGVCIWVAITAL